MVCFSIVKSRGRQRPSHGAPETRSITAQGRSQHLSHSGLAHPGLRIQLPSTAQCIPRQIALVTDDFAASKMIVAGARCPVSCSSTRSSHGRRPLWSFSLASEALAKGEKCVMCAEEQKQKEDKEMASEQAKGKLFCKRNCKRLTN